MLTAFRIFICVAVISNIGRVSPLSGWVEPAITREFRFVVSIGRNFEIPANNPFGHTCGGALLSKRYVLTAASCFLPGKTEKDYFVYAGSSDLAEAEKVEIESWITYDDWWKKRRACWAGNRTYSDNDLAIIRLRKRVSPPAVGMEISKVSPEELVGHDVQTAGWGLLFDDTTPQRMLKANLRVTSHSRCLQNVRNASDDPTYHHEPNFFCTNGVTLFAVLNAGDKGSPVIVNYEGWFYGIVGVNQKSVPWVDNIVRIPDQQNKHIGLHYYINFIKSVSKLKYLD